MSKTPTLAYLRYLLRHKWYVFVAGRRTGAPLWRLLVHDLSKLRPSEWGAYVEKFYGPSAEKRKELRRTDLLVLGRSLTASQEEVDAAFDRAWLLHQRRNAHHWQFWLLVDDSPAPWRAFIGSYDGGMQHHAINDMPRDRADKSEILAVHIDGLGMCNDRDEDRRRFRKVEHLERICKEANTGRRVRALPMPEALVREMVADWAGAGRAITGAWEVAVWYRKNKENILLHPDTRVLVERLVADFSADRAVSSA